MTETLVVYIKVYTTTGESVYNTLYDHSEQVTKIPEEWDSSKIQQLADSIGTMTVAALQLSSTVINQKIHLGKR